MKIGLTAPRRQRAFLQLSATLCAALAILAGVLVMAGWFCHQLWLIQLREQLAPMVFNTALALALTGSAVILSSRRERKLAGALGALAGLIGLLTCLEWIFHVSLGIDELFIRDYIGLGTTPGRMSPLAAFCSLLLGIALMVSCGARRRSLRALVMGSAGTIVLAVSLMALVGYATGLTGAYGWHHLKPMALHTAISEGFLAISILALAWQKNGSPLGAAPRWTALPLALGVLIGSFVLSQALQSKQEGEIQRTNRAMAESALSQIKIQIDGRLLALRRMAQRRGSYEQSEALWRADARNYINDFAGFQAIEWADDASVIRWIEPLRGNEAALNLDLTREARRYRAVQMAKHLMQPVITRPVRLVQGGTGLLVYIPVPTSTGTHGLIVGVFRLKELFDSILPATFAEGYGISIADQDSIIYTRVAPKPAHFSQWNVAGKVDFHGVSWQVSLWPTPALLAREGSALPLGVILGGGAVALLLGLSTVLAQHAVAQAHVARRSERKLRETEERFRRAFDDAPIGMALVALDGRWLQVNRALCRILGYSESELRERDFQTLTHPDDLESDLQQVDRVLAGEIDSYQIDKRYLRKDGSVACAMLSVSLVRDTQGQPLHFVSQIEDITERKQALETLRQSEERFRLLLEGVIDYAIFMLDPQGRIASWNASAQRFTGYRASEIVGKHVSTFYPRDAIAGGLPERELSTATNQGRFEDEGWRLRKDGSRYWASAIVTPIRDSKNELIGFAKVTRDLTERRSAASILRETITLQNAVLSSAAYSIIAADTEGKVTVFNTTAEKMLGYSASEVINQVTPAIWHDPAEITARAREFSATLGIHLEPGFEVFVAKSRLNLPNEHEWTYIRRDGSTFPVLLGVTALRDENGNITGFLGMARDITEDKNVEQERRRLLSELEENNRDLRRQNREIQNFYHTLSHELKTPLTSAREFVAIVLDGLAGEVNGEQREYLEIARSSCTQLQVCINDLLDVTRLETGKLRVSLHKGELEPLLQKIVGSLRPMAGERDLELVLEADGELPTLRFDEARLTQVLNNLVGNAFKFTPAGGTVTVRAWTPPGDFVAISVSDTGRGIPAEKLDRIFERLYQVKESDAATQQGMGLGLYLCRELVQLHGGHIEVKSELDHGSSFTFYLPKPVSAGTGRSVLVVDDEDLIRDGLREAFEPAGFIVSTAEDGYRGLEAASKEMPNLVVMDLKMPNMDGPTMLRELRQRNPDLPVIIHTGYPDGELMSRAWEMSPFTVLAKPCSLQQMVRAARSQLHLDKLSRDAKSPAVAGKDRT